MRGHELLKPLLRAQLTRDEKQLLPRRWQILGDLVLVNIPAKIEYLRYDIGEALLDLYPRCKSVLWDKGVGGNLRKPRVEVIAGSETTTIHKENYCKFALDARRVMFSAGNFAERVRMSKVGNGEKVLDMFAGIGQFCVPMAVHGHPESISAIELNSVAYNYLRQNVKLNHIEDIIQPRLGNCADVASDDQFDRVLMGHFDAYDYLCRGIEALVPSGIVHYHEIVPLELAFERPPANVARAARALSRTAQVLNVRKVKDYAPGIAHVVVDARIHSAHASR
ncbi:MAG TPA: class I SAM-dependent methyltransferase family protein [Candidatus Bathyarchaeia archaeon]|nr:class I SAM-dependent methyltransferase family protein [Candidatus Bathyarchaeia archaeon]